MVTGEAVVIGTVVGAFVVAWDLEPLKKLQSGGFRHGTRRVWIKLLVKTPSSDEAAG